MNSRSSKVPIKRIHCIFAGFGMEKKKLNTLNQVEIKKFIRGYQPFSLLGNITSQTYFQTGTKIPPHQIWKNLIRLVRRDYQKYDGWVIVIDQELLIHAAIAMCFAFEGMSKPIIFTALNPSCIQSPGGSTSAQDHFFCLDNFGFRAELLYAFQISIAQFRGVYISMHHRILPIFMATKSIHNGIELYRAGNIDMVHKASDLDSIFMKINPDIEKKRALRIINRFASHIEWFTLTPHVSLSFFQEKISGTTKAVILDTTYLGFLPPDWKDLILQYPKIIFVVYSSIGAQSFDISAFQNLIISPLMTSEALYVKCSWLLTQCTGVKEITRALNRNYCGELILNQDNSDDL